MKCESCGSVLVGNEKFCNGCGAPVHTVSNTVNQPSSVVMPYANMNNTNSMGYSNGTNVSGMPPKKNNTMTIILVIVLVLLIGGGCAFGGYLLASNNDSDSTSEKDNNDKNDKDDEDEKTPTTAAVYYAGVNFMLSDEYSYTQDTNGLYITNSEWLALIQESNLVFSSVLLVKETLKSNLEQQGMEILSMEEKTLSSKYLVFNANSNGVNCLILMTEIKSGKTLLIMVTDPNGGKASSSWINDVDDILSNVETTSRGNSVDFDFSIFDTFNKILLESDIPSEDVIIDEKPLVDVIVP